MRHIINIHKLVKDNIVSKLVIIGTSPIPKKAHLKPDMR